MIYLHLRNQENFFVFMYIGLKFLVLSNDMLYNLHSLKKQFDVCMLGMFPSFETSRRSQKELLCVVKISNQIFQFSHRFSNLVSSSVFKNSNVYSYTLAI